MSFPIPFDLGAHSSLWGRPWTTLPSPRSRVRSTSPGGPGSHPGVSLFLTVRDFFIHLKSPFGLLPSSVMVPPTQETLNPPCA